jgi:hypothetical protein
MEVLSPTGCVFEILSDGRKRDEDGFRTSVCSHRNPLLFWVCVAVKITLDKVLVRDTKTIQKMPSRLLTPSGNRLPME